jgi:hypothetical protein
MKIFGREPALIIGFVGAVVAVLVGANVPGLSAGAGVALTALVTAAITAWTTRPVAPGLYVGVVVAVAALLAEYNLAVSDTLLSAIGGLIIAGFALFGVRAQVTPAADRAPIAPANGQVR